MAQEKLTTAQRGVVVSVAGGLALLTWWFFWGSKRPQVGGNKESLQVVEALYTAFTSRNPSRLENCETRLHELRDNGKFPRAAADHLDGLIESARGGDWRRATHDLFDFMKAQRYRRPRSTRPFDPVPRPGEGVGGTGHARSREHRLEKR